MLQSKTGKHSEGPIVWSIDDLGQKVVIDEAEQRTVGEEVGPEAARYSSRAPSTRSRTSPENIAQFT